MYRKGGSDQCARRTTRWTSFIITAIGNFPTRYLMPYYILEGCGCCASREFVGTPEELAKVYAEKKEKDKQNKSWCGKGKRASRTPEEIERAARTDEEKEVDLARDRARREARLDEKRQWTRRGYEKQIFYPRMKRKRGSNGT